VTLFENNPRQSPLLDEKPSGMYVAVAQTMRTNFTRYVPKYNDGFHVSTLTKDQ
jgi:hypothetical protein